MRACRRAGAGCCWLRAGLRRRNVTRPDHRRTAPAPNMPRVAVLECDVRKDFPSSVGACFYGEIAQHWLSDAEDSPSDWQWVQFHVNAADPQLPTSVNDFDGFVIPGSAANVTDDSPWIPRLVLLVQQAHAKGKALFGVCFGHQIIAMALGGHCAARPPFNFTVDNVLLLPATQRCPFSEDLMGGRGGGGGGGSEGGPAAATAGSEKTLRLYKSHGFQVLRPPTNAIVLACSHRTAVEMYCIGETVFCVQGHPEFSQEVMLLIAARLASTSTLPPAALDKASKKIAASLETGCTPQDQRLDAARIRRLVRKMLVRSEERPSWRRRIPGRGESTTQAACAAACVCSAATAVAAAGGAAVALERCRF